MRPTLELAHRFLSQRKRAEVEADASYRSAYRASGQLLLVALVASIDISLAANRHYAASLSVSIAGLPLALLLGHMLADTLWRRTRAVALGISGSVLAHLAILEGKHTEETSRILSSMLPQEKIENLLEERLRAYLAARDSILPMQPLEARIQGEELAPRSLDGDMTDPTLALETTPSSTYPGINKSTPSSFGGRANAVPLGEMAHLPSETFRDGMRSTIQTVDEE